MRLIVFISILFTSGFAWNFVAAQDTILNMQNKKIAAKVIEVGPREIKYKATNNPDGPLYIILRNQVSQITYSDGTVDTISMKKPVTKTIKQKTDPRVKDFRRNYIYFTPTDIYMGQLSGGYERFTKKGNLGYKAHLSFGLINMGLRDEVNVGSELNNINDRGYFYPDKIFSASIDASYFPADQGTFRYFIGPSIEYGQYYEKNYMHYTYEPYENYIKKVRRGYVSILFKNGIMYQLSKTFCFTAFMGAGGYATNGNNNSFPDGLIMFEMGINVGVRF